MHPDAYREMAAVEDRHWWFRGRRRILIATIKRLNLPPGAKILELGSGTGGNLLALAAFGEVTAVEMNAAAREISRVKAAAVAVLAGVLPDDLPLGARTFDLICLFDVLEHVEDDAAVLAVVRRHLAPGGAALITVPAYQALFGPHDVALHHHRRYERAGLAAKLRAAGLQVQKLSFINMALLPAAWAARWLDRVLRRRTAVGSGLPPAPVNALFAALFGAESLILPWADLPCGLSLLAVVRPAEAR